MANPVPSTVKEQIAWSYANLARAHAALEDGALKYTQLHHIIRSKLYHGLIKGTLAMRTLYDDERLKMTAPQACYYCGCAGPLAVDHLIPRIRGGADEADNLIWACRSCNSSKSGRDLLEWAEVKGFFPPILLLRRFLKLVARHCESKGAMECKLSDPQLANLSVNVHALPLSYPPLSEMKLWVDPT